LAARTGDGGDAQAAGGAVLSAGLTVGAIQFPAMLPGRPRNPVCGKLLAHDCTSGTPDAS
jgi:hypothetical protein